MFSCCFCGLQCRNPPSTEVDFARQMDRVQSLRPPGRIGIPSDIVLPDDLPYNRNRMLPTHNSYRGRPTLRLMFIDLAQNCNPPADYGHPPLTEQFEAWIRSFEMDLRWGRRGLECSHVPLVDDAAQSPFFPRPAGCAALVGTESPSRAACVSSGAEGRLPLLEPALKEIVPAELDQIGRRPARVPGPPAVPARQLEKPGCKPSESVRKWGCRTWRTSRRCHRDPPRERDLPLDYLSRHPARRARDVHVVLCPMTPEGAGHRRSERIP